MSFIISIPDAFRQSVESATGGRNTVLYDNKGYPSIMVVVPKFRLSDIVGSWPSDPHPAFIVNDQEKPYIFVGKYQAIVHDGRALSLPGQDPAVGLNFDNALSYCAAKGSGWHLMTNAEWAAIALWCWKNGFLPRGNTSYDEAAGVPRSHAATYEVAVKATDGTDGRARTGTGPATWAHDGTPAGIYDLCGNIWEWVGGMRLQDGMIQVIPDNDAANNTVDQSGSSTAWRAISDTGAYVDPAGTDTKMYYDSTGTGTSGDVGDILVNTSVTNNTGDTAYAYNYFRATAAASGVTVPDLLRQLCLFPVTDSETFEGRHWMRNSGERLPLRGGHWGCGADAGVFALNLNHLRSHVYWNVGFRPAFVNL